jgi:hypothetical protein
LTHKDVLVALADVVGTDEVGSRLLSSLVALT